MILATEGACETPTDDAMIGTPEGNRFEASWVERYRQWHARVTRRTLTYIELTGENAGCNNCTNKARYRGFMNLRRLSSELSDAILLFSADAKITVNADFIHGHEIKHIVQ